MADDGTRRWHDGDPATVGALRALLAEFHDEDLVWITTNYDDVGGIEVYHEHPWRRLARITTEAEMWASVEMWLRRLEASDGVR